MKQFFLTMAGVFAGLLLFFIGVPFVIIGMIAAASKPAPPPSNTLLSLDLRQAIVDQDNSAGFSFFGPKPLSVMTVAQGLRAAAHDNRVKGLMLRLPEGGMAPAAADEIRLAVKSFRASGKPVYAYSQGIYPGGITSATYMVGAAADQLWMQPGASLQSTGLGTEEMFFKRFFDKYGITADYQQGEFGQIIESNQEAAQAITNYMTSASNFDVDEASQFIQQFTIAKQIEQVEKLLEE